MKLREPVIRKHVCQYKVTDEYDNSVHHFIERECTGCGKVQTAEFSKPLELPAALSVYADAQWLDCPLHKYLYSKQNDLVA